MRTGFVISLFLALACGGAPSPSGPTADTAARFADLDCASGESVHRSWCPVAAAGHGPFVLSGGTKVRMGLSMALRPGERPLDVVLERTSLSALFVGGSGAKVIAITPSKEEEKEALAAAVMSVAIVLKKGGGLKLDPALATYVKGQAVDLYPLTLDEHGGTFTGSGGPTEIQRITGNWGAAWVVVEEVIDGTYVSVFPDVPID